MTLEGSQTRPGGKTSLNAATHGLRGVASLMVFFAHMASGLGEHVYPTRTAYVEGILPYWNVGTFGVDLFFVISGFVILPSAMAYDWREFAARRFMRLYPLFFCLTLVFIAVNLATNIQPKANDPWAVVVALTFLDIFTPTEQLTPNAWSLTFEVWFYVLTAAGVFVSLRGHAIGRAVVGAAVLAFLAFYPIAFYFIAGLLVRLAYDRWDWVRTGHHRRTEFAMLGVCIALASLGHYDYDWIDFQNPVLTLLIVATGIYFCLAVSENSLTTRIVSHRILFYFGTVSYSLYLVHPYIYYGMRVLLLRAGFFAFDIATSVTLFMTATLVVVVPVTHLVHIVLERWPYEWAYGRRPLGAPARLGARRTRRRAVA